MKLSMHWATCAVAVVSLCGASTALRAETTVRVGLVRSITSGVTYDAIERGYFKEFGIKVESQDLDTTANSIALLSQNQFDIIEGGISAGYFNGLEKDLPITMVMDRVSTPIGHNLMLRPDLKGQITDVKQLKGKVIATNGTGSVSTYEIGKVIATGGLGINDVDLKVLPFTQYALAFANKAIDAAQVIPPWTTQFVKDNIAVPFLSIGRTRQADADDDRRRDDQHRLGEEGSGFGAELFRRLSARRPRLLSGLSRRTEPQGIHRHAGANRRRAPAGNPQ